MENLRLLARLSSETQPLHAAVDAELDHLLAEPGPRAYRDWLLRRYGFLAPLEAALDTTYRFGDLVDVHRRRKAAHLRSDLLALGVSHAAVTSAPICAGVPKTFTRIPTAFGWLYAAERSMHQHGNAFRQLARVLPGELAFASSYLKCYESTVGVMWRSLDTALDAACKTAEDTCELFIAAQDALRCLARWQAHRVGTCLV